jgi:hypothetical protein
VTAPKVRSDYARWKAGFEAANAADIEARRRSTPDKDLAAFAGLLEAATVFGWDIQLREGDDEVRGRWLRLWHYARRA